LRANDPPAAARSQRDAENAAYPIIEDAVLRGTLSYSDYKGIQTLLRGQFHQDCAGDQCINNCTDLGRQLTQQNACKQQLLTALEMALGKPTRELGGSFPPQGFKAYVDPDQVNLPVAADIGTCIPSLSTPLPQLADACGVALCTDDQLSQATVGGCRCGHDAVTFTPTNRQCVFENWGPDQVPTDNCGKVPRQAPGTIPPGGPPPPVDQ